MSINKNSGDPGKFYSLFGGPESYQTFGPGQADFITVPGPNQTGPLLNLPLLMQELGQPKATREQIEGIFNNRPLKDRKLPPKGRAVAQNEDNIRSDAMPQNSATPSTKMKKGDKRPASTDPLSEGPLAGLLALLSGEMPWNGMSGGGTTTVPKGQSPYVQQAEVPERNPFFESGPDESILANLIRGPQAMAANQSQPMTSLPPMMQEAQKAGAYGGTPAAAPTAASWAPDNPVTPPTLRPPVPTPNENFHPQVNDLRSIGAMLAEMFGEGPGLTPPNPVRNPMFSGGI